MGSLLRRDKIAGRQLYSTTDAIIKIEIYWKDRCQASVIGESGGVGAVSRDVDEVELFEDIPGG